MKSNFFDHLRDEKIKTEGVRSGFVVQKLLFATALLGAGAGTTGLANINLRILLYLVPYVSLVFDLYYLAEDYSVKRIGGYLGAKSADPDEHGWESWVGAHRDPFAPFSMSLLTLLITAGAAFAVWHEGTTVNRWFILYFGLAALSSAFLSILYGWLKKQISVSLGQPACRSDQKKVPEQLIELRGIVKRSDHILDRRTFTEIKKHFELEQKEMQSLTSEFGKGEFLQCVNRKGVVVKTDARILKDFRKIVKHYPEFDQWFKESVIEENDKKIPVLLVARWLCHLIGIRHLSVHLFIDHPNWNGYTLVQVRSLKKFEAPGHFDLPVAGHVKENESEEHTLECECREELNLAPTDIITPKRLGGYEYSSPPGVSNIQNIEFRSVYRSTIKSESLARIKFSDQEVAAISIFSVPDLQKLINGPSEHVASGLEKSFPVYLKKVRKKLS